MIPVRQGTVHLDRTNNFSGWPSMSLQIKAGAAEGTAGIANRGLGNEGLYFKQGVPYEGYFFAHSDKPVTLEVRMMGGSSFTERLAVQRITHTPPSVETRHDSKANPG